MTQPLLLDAPSEPPKSPCQKLIEAHGIITEFHRSAWWAFVPNEEGAAFFSETREDAVFGLCGQLHLDMKLILK